MIKALSWAAAIALASAPAFSMDRPAVLSAIQPRLKVLLRDVDTAKIEVTRDPRKGAVDMGSVLGQRSGEIVCAKINATNGFGGYTGFKAYLFVIQDGGNVVALSEDTFDSAIIERECAKPADPS